MNRGILYALGSYVLWGLLPIYWKALATIPALEIVAHRVLWSTLFTAVIITTAQNWRWLRPTLRNPRAWLIFCSTGVLLLANWLVYIVAVNTGHVVETSLGYFINPLVNVMLAVLFLGERPRPLQWAAVALAATGVAYLTITYGQLPWIALTLAFSFGFYALIKKRSRLASLDGLFLEMAVLAPAMLLVLVYFGVLDDRSATQSGWLTPILLVFSGVVTALPLLLFSAGAKRVPLTVLGVLQYIAPTIQLFLGVWLYREPFSPHRLIGFALVWAALALFVVESLAMRRRPYLSPRTTVAV